MRDFSCSLHRSTISVSVTSYFLFALILLQIKNDKLARQSVLLSNSHSDMSIRMNGHDQVCLKLATSLVGAAHKVCRQVLIDRPVTATSPWDLKVQLQSILILTA